MEEKIKKSEGAEEPEYVFGATGKKFDVARLPGFSDELSEILQSLVIYPSRKFSVEIPELAESIPAQIKATLDQIQDLKKTDLELASEIERKYLEALENYIVEIEVSYFTLFVTGLFFLGVTYGLANIESNQLLVSAGILLVQVALLAISLAILDELHKRTLDPYKFATKRLADIQDKIGNDLIKAGIGRVPPRFRRKLNRAFVGKLAETDENVWKTQFAEGLALIENLNDNKSETFTKVGEDHVTGAKTQENS